MTGVIRSKENPVVFLDISINKTKAGRLTFQLFADIAPKASENFRKFCTGQTLYKEKPAGYKQTCIHHLESDKFFEGGDFIYDGINSKPKMSIYGFDKYFEDESFEMKHNEIGLLSMVSVGPNTNGNMFRVIIGGCPEFDGKNVVFGKVVDDNSIKVIKLINQVAVNSEGKPKMAVIIKECGEM